MTVGVDEDGGWPRAGLDEGRSMRFRICLGGGVGGLLAPGSVGKVQARLPYRP